MRKLLPCLLIIIAFSAGGFSWDNTSAQLTDTLLEALNNKPRYTALRQRRLDSLARLLAEPGIPSARQLELTLGLADGYTRFDANRAIEFTRRGAALARRGGSPVVETRQTLRLANLLCKTSQFREAWQIIDSLSPQTLPDPSLLPDYLYSLMNYWETYAASVPNGEAAFRNYLAVREKYLEVASDTTFEARTRRTGIRMDNNPAEGEKLLLELAKGEEYGSPNWGGIMYMLSIARMLQGDKEGERKYLQLAAIADTRSALREHASLQTLADVELAMGQPTDRVFLYAQNAMEDALQSGIRFRMNQMHDLYALVNRQAEEQQGREQRRLTTFLCIVGGLLLALVAVLVVVFIQKRRLHRAHISVALSNTQLEEANGQLSSTLAKLNDANEELADKNRQLRETGRIKERYIAEFFNRYSAYLMAVDRSRAQTAKLLRQGKGAELLERIEASESLEREFAELYRHFDTVFLSLYPDFVERVNSLLLPDGQIELRPGEQLNRELRLYALQTLGIADSQRVASFLRCSLSTIYNFRTSLRRRARGGREAFDAALASLS